MRDFSDSKLMAKSLRAALAAQGMVVSHAQALELVARQFDFPSWNVLAARIAAATDEPELKPVIPVIRSFDGDKAREFYLGYLGFTVDWEHRHEPGLPLYFQASRSGCLLHISEHHGDATPGGRSFIRILGVERFHAELRSKSYPNMNPGLDRRPWGIEVNLTDPFGNRLTFCEQRSAAGSGS